jgi:polyhydroxyalkanoate synthase
MTTEHTEDRRQRIPQDDAAGDAAPGTATADNPLRPDMALAVWMSWMESNFGHAPMSNTEPWWTVTPEQMTDNMLSAGSRQLNEVLARDPLLRSIDQMWNANPFREIVPVDWAEIARALRTVWMLSLAKPGESMQSAAELNARMWQSTIDNWNEAGQRWLSFAGQQPTDGARQKGDDKRFTAPEWHSNPVYRTLKEMYLLASDWLIKHGKDVEGLDDAERQRLNFHLQQFVDAMSPTLLLVSNPAALRKALETGGASLAAGAQNLLSDLKEGRLSMVDTTTFAPGRNMAMTPGKVVFRNRLIELIQYEPTTKTVHAVPIMIMPPWINKYYILDLQPKNSMVRHLVDQGFTVFMVSWKNPDASMDEITFEDYMDLGPLAASDAIRDITGSATVNPMGYCIAGTLLISTLAWLATQGDKRFNSATFMVSMQDFSKVGDTGIFMSEDKIDFIEQQMLERGYLDSREMSNMFNLLRSNDLIWANVVNNYLMGEKPPAFDLLYWNSDGTRMCRAAHSWYLRNTYVENNLMVPGKVMLKGAPIDLGNVTQDVYAVGAEKDHIVPWEAAWQINQLVKGDVRYVLASSGHIAGIINPPGGRGTYWISESDNSAATADEWRENAATHQGSWWIDWFSWLAKHSGRKVKPPALGSERYPVLQASPGTYVLEK